MIVTKKMLIGAAVIPIIIALVIAIPKISPGGDQTATSASSIRIEFVKEDIKRISYGVTERAGALKSETLLIDEKGQAFYNVNVEGEKGEQRRFQLGSQDVKRLKSLIADTGFMQIPKSDFAVKDAASEFTKYTLKVTLDNQTKTVQWVNESASEDFVPPLLTMLSDTLAQIVEEYNN